MFRGHIIFAAALAGVIAMATPSRAETGRSATVPEMKQQGEVSYVSGGVGDEEQKQLEEIAKGYNLKITFAGPSGAYGGGSRVAIRNSAGKTVLDAQSRGPLFYAELPPGRYNITSSEFGRAAQTKTVELGARGRSDVLFTVQQAERTLDASDPRSAGR